MKTKLLFILSGVGLALAIWYGSAKFQKIKLQNSMYKQNEQYRKNLDEKLALKDSTISTLFRQTVSKKDLSDYLETHDKDLKNWITKENKINLRKVQSIIKSQLVYVNKDTTIVDLQPVLEAIAKGELKARVPFTDSIQDCLIIKGYVLLDGKKLDLVITDREFKNTTKGVAFIRRDKWKLVFFNTRLFGKRKLEIILEDSCGKSHSMILDISKR